MRRLLTITTVIMVALVPAPPVVADATVVVRGTDTAPDDLIAVQAAVDEARQVVLEGTFDFGNGTLVIDSNTTLRGRRGTTILNGGDADNLDPTIFAVPPATRVTIRGLTMQGAADVAIFTEGVKAVIRDNAIALANSGFGGIVVKDGDGSRVSRNTITDAPVGLVVELTDAAHVHNNTVGVFEIGLALFATSHSAVTNNSLSLVGDSPPVIFGLGKTGVFFGSVDVNGTSVGSPDNVIRNTTLSGEMTYGYLLGAGSQSNSVVIARRSLDEATFVPPPFFGVCKNGPSELEEGGATVIFSGANDFGPAAQDNTVWNRARSATFLDCGIGNEVRGR